MEVCMIWNDGEIDTSILEFNYIHAHHNGNCYDAKGKAKYIKELEKMAAKHHVHTEHGKCEFTEKPECKDWRHMKICRTAPHKHHGAEEWNGGRNIHGVMKHGGKEYCMQYDGKTIRDAKVDDLIAKKMEAAHVTMKEGGCHQAGFAGIVHTIKAGDMTISVWAH